MRRKKLKDMRPEDVYLGQPYPTTLHSYVGIELEFISPLNLEAVAELLVKQPFAMQCSIDTDGSVCELTEDGDDDWYDENGEPRYGLELKLLCTQPEVPRIVQQACGFIRELGGYVNETCGLHVHLDMRNRAPDWAFNRLLQAQRVLYSLCPVERRDGTYARPIAPGTSFSQALGSLDRYTGINATAYSKYKTLEIRMHEGTLKAGEITAWVDLLCRVARARSLLGTVDTLAQLAKCVPLPTPTLECLKRRQQRFARRSARAEAVEQIINAA